MDSAMEDADAGADGDGVENGRASDNGARERGQGASAAQRPVKHRRDSSVSITIDESVQQDGLGQARPAAKRIATGESVAQESSAAATLHTTEQASSSSNGTVQTPAAVTEYEVGIRAYVDETLVPIQGGIIKQRFADFHVREVAPDGTVCRITSLEPTHSDADDNDGNGSSLYAQLRAEQAERDDASGALRQERIQREQEARAAKEAERKKHAERVYTWDTITLEHKRKLKALFGAEVQHLKELWEAGPRPGHRDDRTVTTVSMSDKEQRRAAHQLVREAFEGLLVTTTLTDASKDGQGALVARWDAAAGTPRQDQRAMRNQQRPTALSAAADDAPPYIHFLLQKTNRDSQDALNLIARGLGLMKGGGSWHGGAGKAVTDLTIAGTKDKRGITVQRVALKRGRKTVDDVWRILNGASAGGRGAKGGGRGGHFGRGLQPRTLVDAVSLRGERGIRVAHLRYANEGLYLGALAGNEFGIVLRNVKVSSRATIDAAIDVLKTKGFINYYGMQRFGTSSISTHTVGIACLRRDFCRAVNLIMAPRDGDTDMAMSAREAYAQGDLDRALRLFPNHNVPERAIVSRMRSDRHLFTVGQNPSTVTQVDWYKYFAALPRTLRSMYVHAYQSYAWNCLASERVKRFGTEKPVIGDYVLLGPLPEDEQAKDANDVPDDDIAQMDLGDDVQPASLRKRVKVIETQDEAQQYAIHDVVIPLFGSDVQPIHNDQNWMAKLYAETLAKDGLTPEDIARCGKVMPEASMRGDYRALLHVPKNVAYHLVRYSDPDINLLQSDEDAIIGLDPAPPAVDQDADLTSTDASLAPFLALVLHFQLGSSAYATMALREILKQETSMAHQRDLTARGEDRLPIS